MAKEKQDLLHRVNRFVLVLGCGSPRYVIGQYRNLVKHLEEHNRDWRHVDFLSLNFLASLVRVRINCSDLPRGWATIDRWIRGITFTRNFIRNFAADITKFSRQVNVLRVERLDPCSSIDTTARANLLSWKLLAATSTRRKLALLARKLCACFSSHRAFSFAFSSLSLSEIDLSEGRLQFVKEISFRHIRRLWFVSMKREIRETRCGENVTQIHKYRSCLARAKCSSFVVERNSVSQRQIKQNSVIDVNAEMEREKERWK